MSGALDKNGQQLQQGSRVLIEGEVTGIAGGENPTATIKAAGAPEFTLPTRACSNMQTGTAAQQAAGS